MVDDVIVVELAGDFALNADDALNASDPQDLVDVAIATGFGAERVLKFVSGISQPAVDTMRKFVSQVVRANQVTGFKVTKNGVKVASFPVERTKEVMELIDSTLDKLRDR